MSLNLCCKSQRHLTDVLAAYMVRNDRDTGAKNDTINI